MSRKIIVGIGVVLWVGLVFILSVGLAYERGHNSGYNEGWNDSWAEGEAEGWRGCIEENNLYERYYYENR